MDQGNIHQTEINPLLLQESTGVLCAKLMTKFLPNIEFSINF